VLMNGNYSNNYICTLQGLPTHPPQGYKHKLAESAAAADPVHHLMTSDGPKTMPKTCRTSATQSAADSQSVRAMRASKVSWTKYTAPRNFPLSKNGLSLSGREAAYFVGT
jgi:hypothetical protein